MKSDADIERQVEDWLEGEARSMPHHVLESALEAISRTAQVGRQRRLGLHWLNQRVLVVAMAAAVVVLALVASPTILESIGGLFRLQPGVGPEASADGDRLWDPAADFRSSPNQLNPSPDSYGNAEVWSYMRSANANHNPANYILLPNFQVADGDADQWYERDMVNLFVAHVPGSSTLALHPWSAGGAVDDRRNPILAWRSPIGGQVTATGTVQMGQPTCAEPANGITFSIDLGAESLRTLTIGLGRDARFEVTTTVEPGESLYFIVDAGSDARCDLTLLTLAITR